MGVPSVGFRLGLSRLRDAARRRVTAAARGERRWLPAGERRLGAIDVVGVSDS